MPLFQIVRGVSSSNEQVTKPGDIVDWSDERASAWYPRDKGAIVRVSDPRLLQAKLPAVEEATVEPVTSSPYQDLEPEPEPDPKPEKRSKKHYRGR